MTLPVAVCVSGRGTNLQALIDAIASGRLDARIVLVASNRADAVALVRAQRAGVPTAIHPVTNATRGPSQAAMGAAIRSSGARLVVLAGYDRVLADDFWDALGDVPVINLHASLLPAFAGLLGLKVHEAVIASGVSETGATVHTAHRGMLDAGAILVQKRVPVLPGDTPDMLAARVLGHEHDVLVDAVARYCRAADTAPAR